MQIEGKDLIGFVMTDHMKKEEYKVGKSIVAKVLDMDKERKLLDLSHSNHFIEISKTTRKSQLITCQHKNLIPSLLPFITKFSKGKNLDARVELVKELYAILSLLEHPYVLALIPIQLFNRDEKEAQVNKLSIGHTLSIRLVKFSEAHQVFLAVPFITNLRKIWDTDSDTGPSIKFSELDIDPKTIQVGQKLSGKINSVQNYTAFVHFNKKIYGRLHKAQCGSEERFMEMRKGALITVYVLAIAIDKEKELYKLDLSLDPDTKSGSFKANNSCLAVIKVVQWNSTYPLLLELSACTRAFVHFKDLVADPQKLETERQRLKEGSIITCYPQFDLGQEEGDKPRASLYLKEEETEESIKMGKLIICRYITSKEGCGVSVQINEKQGGIIDITEISDEFGAKPFDELKKKGVFTARVLEIIKETKIILTARKSLLDEKIWKAITIDNTYKFQQYDYINEKADLRTKIIKFGTEWLQPGMIGLGYISNINDKGCFIKVSYKLTVRASLRELTDVEIVNPVAIYKQNDLVLFRVISIVESQKGQELYKQKYVNVSLRESIVKFGFGVALKDLKVGQPCQAIIRKIGEQVQAQIKGSSFVAIVKGVPSEMLEGELIRCTIHKIEVPENRKNPKIKLKYEGKVDILSEPNEVEELYEKIMGYYRITKTEPMQDINNEEELVLKDGDLDDLEEIEEDKGEIIIRETINETDSDKEVENIIEDDNKQEDNKEEDKMEDIIEDSDKESKGHKGTTLKEKIREEKRIRQIEKANLTQSQPQSLDDFEKAVLAEPNNSLIWLQYVAFILDNAGIDSARRVLERAVKIILPTQEQDKLNLWIGYLNLESTYGDTESLQRVATRAIEINDKKKIYNALANIYFCSKRYELALDVHKLLVKKYYDDILIWSQYTDFLFKLIQIKADKEHEDYEKVIAIEFLEPKEVLSRALQALDRKKSVDMIVKYGQQEYKYGNIENGRTMFEGVLNSHPGRTDIWNVYFDMEVKHGKSKDYVRGLFERCLKLKLKEEKMKFFFKKYLNYELSYGTPATVENIKKKANDYIETIS